MMKKLPRANMDGVFLHNAGKHFDEKPPFYCGLAEHPRGPHISMFRNEKTLLSASRFIISLPTIPMYDHFIADSFDDVVVYAALAMPASEVIEVSMHGGFHWTEKTSVIFDMIESFKIFLTAARNL